jgi:16S rRNA (guanine966-N2)-methyltransferase
MKKSSLSQHRVRIIAGFWRSRQVEIVDASGLRPSTDRVRETVFNWLNPYLNQSKVIDLFAGTGILGMESCSRGAKETLFIEKNPVVFRALQNNLEKLKPNPPNSVITALAMDALLWLKKQDSIDADLIFIDPPFEQVNLLEEALLLINAKTKMDTPPIIYVESSSTLDIDSILQKLASWKVEKQLVAGAVRASVLMFRKDV